MGDGDGDDGFDGRDRAESSETDDDDRPSATNDGSSPMANNDSSPAANDGSGPSGAERDKWTPTGDRTRGSEASQRPGDASHVTIEDDGHLRWFLKTENESVMIVRDVLTSVAIVAVIGLLLFGISGIWPPMVAVESGSMQPNMQEGDLIFIVDTDRFVGDGPIEGTGVVPLENGEESGHEKFNKPGDVVVFQPDGSDRTPVIHRAHYWVEEGDNWVDEKADPGVIGETSCDDIETCPANHAGFITKGDYNDGYDQQPRAGTTTDVVKPEWVTAKATFRIPWLGNVRLLFDEYLLSSIAAGPLEVGPIDGGPLEDDRLPAGAIGAVTVGSGGMAAVAAVAGRRRFERY